MPWMKTLLKHIAEGVIETIFEPRGRRSYEDEGAYYGPGDDGEPLPPYSDPDPDPYDRGPEIPLHFNKWRDDEEGEPR